jgi:NCAIR mutase (PurE)-related protein
VLEDRAQKKGVTLMTVKKGPKRQNEAAKVGIVMGSDSDLDIMQEAAAVLKKFQIPYEMTVASAHRSPQRAGDFAAILPPPL